MVYFEKKISQCDNSLLPLLPVIEALTLRYEISVIVTLKCNRIPIENVAHQPVHRPPQWPADHLQAMRCDLNMTFCSCSDMDVVLEVLNVLYVFSKRSNFMGRLSAPRKQEIVIRLLYLAEVSSVTGIL